MDKKEALQAVSIMRPRPVIPCHCNCPGLFSRKHNPADDPMFKREMEKAGAECVILREGQSIEL